VVVTAGDTGTEPLGGCDPTPKLIETEVAFAVVQLNIDVWPAVIVGGVAVNETTVGGGDAAFTVTVAFALAVPPGPVAVKVYVVVAVGDTDTLPLTGSTVPLIETDVAFVVVQVRVDDWPRVIVEGLAVKELTVGAEDCAVMIRETEIVLDGLEIKGGTVWIVEGVVSAIVITSAYVPAPSAAATEGLIDALKIVASPGPNVIRGPPIPSHA
jgi:hypothetical protein